MSAWDAEYRRGGIPSSIRDGPSEAVVWALDAWPRLHGAPDLPRRALDVGCGRARNTAYLAGRGLHVVGFDTSEVAIADGLARLDAEDLDAALLVHDLRDGLPVPDSTIDIVVDTFVCKHVVQPADRRRYRTELDRVLSPGGRVLVTLADRADGYYAACPPLDEPGAGPNAVLDPVAGVGSVLFTLEELMAEVADTLELELAWRKQKPGTMHGRTYVRCTLATLWRRG